MHINKSNDTKVLFFGKKDCSYSERLLAYLEHLGFNVVSILSTSRKEPLAENILQWHGDYIFCFRSYYILRKEFLARASIAAINFHPAPVEYPGSGCLNWALYENAGLYGATAHIMNEKVDNGTIIECRRFPILPQDSVTTLLERTHLKTFDLAVDITTGLAAAGKVFLDNKIAASQHEQWRGNARKIQDLDCLQIIEPSCSKQELERIIRATYTPDFPPAIHLHGYKFTLRL
jgi:methionyl-tRNA formyltransferase